MVHETLESFQGQNNGCISKILQNETNGNFTGDVTTFCDKTTGQPDVAFQHVAPLWRTDFVLAVIYCIVVGVALLLGTFGNIIILIVTISTKAMNKIGRHFVINLALADLCVAAIADPMCIIGVVKGEAWFNDKWILCEIVAAMCLTACFCAFLSLTNVTVNRYMYVCHYKIYHKVYTKTRALFLCLSCWILAFLFEFPNFVGWGDHYFDQKSHQCIWDRTADLSYTVFVAAGLIGSPLCLMALCFTLIFRKIWKTKYNVFSLDKEDMNRMQKTWKESLRASRTLVVIFFVFIICWTPYAIVTAIDVKDAFSMETHLFVTLLAHMHSSLNIVIYTFTNKNFRRSVRDIFCIKALKYTTSLDSRSVTEKVGSTSNISTSTSTSTVSGDGVKTIDGLKNGLEPPAGIGNQIPEKGFPPPNYSITNGVGQESTHSLSERNGHV